MIFPEWLRDLWQGLTAVVPVLFFLGFAWLKTQFASNAEVAKLTIAMARVEHQIVSMKNDIEAPPTRSEVMAQISRVMERLSAVEEGNKAVIRQLKTQNDYLHTLIEKGLKHDS